jgi:hypothetical protein
MREHVQQEPEEEQNVSMCGSALVRVESYGGCNPRRYRAHPGSTPRFES